MSAPVRPGLWTDRPEARALLAAAVANPPRKAAFRVRDLTDRHELRYTGRIPTALRDVQGAHLDVLIRLESRGRISRAEVLRNWKLTPTIAIDQARAAPAKSDINVADPSKAPSLAAVESIFCQSPG